MWNPETVARLQHATRLNSAKTYEEFAEEVNNLTGRWPRWVGLLEFREGNPIPLNSGARVGNREALLHRRHVLRIHQRGGP